MLDTSLLSSVARQMMSADEVEVEGKRLSAGKVNRVTLPATWYSSKARCWASNRDRSTPSLDKKNNFQSGNPKSFAPDGWCCLR